ncbi:hypothetical protein HJFPF1_12688 [Paramyrothecium foliicola]|nr:hypothetical protein HJFPF1_12688 [Paramyrothecium foliicola]
MSLTHENDGIGRTSSIITATRGEGDLPPPTGNRIRCVTEVTVTSERLDGGSDPSVGSTSDGTESHQIVDDTIPTIVVSSASTSEFWHRLVRCLVFLLRRGRQFLDGNESHQIVDDTIPTIIIFSASTS